MLSERSSSLTPSYSAPLIPPAPRTDARGKPRGSDAPASFAGAPSLCQCRLFPHPSLEMLLLCTKPSEHQQSPKPHCSCRDVPARGFNALIVCPRSTPGNGFPSRLSQPQVSHLPSADVLRGDLRASDDRWLQSREHIFKICLL